MEAAVSQCLFVISQINP